MTLSNLSPALGIDVGGTNIKSAVVSFSSGAHLTGSVHTCATPQPSTPQAVARAIQDLRGHFNWNGPEAIGFPARLRAGVVDAVTNLDDSWVGIDPSKELAPPTGATTVFNDADAAGLGETAFGAAAESDGLVLLVTVGTGIGSALVYRGLLLEGTELGLLPCELTTAQEHAAMSAIDRDNLSLPEWAGRLGTVLRMYESLLAPEVIVVGGAAASWVDQFRDVFEVPCPVRPARLGNRAGIVGAAFAAAQAQT